MHQLTPEQRFAELLAAAPGRPFVTYYDETTGERSELSAKSLANWVAKTHHLLGTELGLGVGDTALVALPPHWIAVPVLLGALSAGLELVAAGGADVAFGTLENIGDLDAGDRYAIAPAAAAFGLRGAEPDGALDYVAAVRPQADAWASVTFPAGPDDPALPGLTRGELSARAAESAKRSGLSPGGRLLSTRDWSTPADWVDAIFAPLAVGGSVVLVRNAEPAVLERRAEQERITARSS